MRGSVSVPARGPQNGASLVTVLMVVAMMLALAFTVVAIAFNHLNLSFKSTNSSKAKHLAEATLARAIHEVMENHNFGNEGTPSETVRVTFSSLPADSEGILTFDEQVANSEGLPYSVNNRGESPVIGADNKSVPGESVHLVARGRVKNANSVVEAVLSVPRFPYSIAADGEIHSTGGLVVASVRPGVMYDLNYSLHEEDLLPGHILSNSLSGVSAIDLQGENRIYGDLQSASGVTLTEQTSVLGEVRENADAEPLPTVDIYSYDPIDRPGLNQVYSSAGVLEVEGYNRANGDLVVDNGIRLNGGTLFVDGNLQVSAGGVSGKGALIATGEMRISGDGEATSDNQAALIAKGDITLKGLSSKKARFAGLIYTEGKLSADNLRLAGVFVAADKGSGPGSERGSVQLDNTEVYQDSSKSVIDVRDKFEIPNLPVITSQLDDYKVVGSYDRDLFLQNLDNYQNPNSGPGEPPYLFKFTSTHSDTEYSTVEYIDGFPVEVPTTGPDEYLIDGQALGLTLWGQAVSSLAQTEAIIIEKFEQEWAKRDEVLSEEQRTHLIKAAKGMWYARQTGYLLAASSALYGRNQGESQGSNSDFEFKVDLSDFFNTADHMRVVYWSEYKN